MNFNDDQIRRRDIPRDCFLLLHDLCYHHDGRDVNDYVSRAKQIISSTSAEQEFVNETRVVMFRAGLLAAREYLARFVEVESPSIAASIRANWWPSLGDDPGPPRQLKFSEVAGGGEEGPWTAKDIQSSVEALPVAWAFLKLPASESRDKEPCSVCGEIHHERDLRDAVGKTQNMRVPAPDKRGSVFTALQVAKQTIDNWTRDSEGRVTVHPDVVSKAVNAAISALRNPDEKAKVNVVQKDGEEIVPAWKRFARITRPCDKIGFPVRHQGRKVVSVATTPTCTSTEFLKAPQKVVTKSNRHDPHHLQRAWLARLKHDKTLVTVWTINSPIPMCSLRVKDFDTYTVCFVEQLSDMERIYVLFKHAIVGFQVYASSLTSTPE